MSLMYWWEKIAWQILELVDIYFIDDGDRQRREVSALHRRTAELQVFSLE